MSKFAETKWQNAVYPHNFEKKYAVKEQINVGISNDYTITPATENSSAKNIPPKGV